MGDFWDSWEQLKERFAVCERWAPYIMTGAWPDADMLPLGRLGIRAERGDDRQTCFTPDEQRTLLMLWSIFRSPLMFGGDLPSTNQDLWSGRVLGAVTGEFAPYIRRHGAGFYRLSSPKTRQ